MPSGMQGFKKSAEEGGIRNFLAVKGPGVPAGVLDFTLTSIQVSCRCVYVSVACGGVRGVLFGALDAGT